MSNFNVNSRRVYFVLMDIEDAPLRVTNAGHTLYWDQDLGGDDYTWLGAGEIGEIDGLGSNTQMAVESITLTLTSIDNDHIGELDDHEYMGRDVKVWQCDLDDSNRVERAVLRFVGYMDSAGIRRGLSSTISMVCKSAHATWAHPYYERINHETQQRLHPGDLGCQYVSSIAGLVLKL